MFASSNWVTLCTISPVSRPSGELFKGTKVCWRVSMLSSTCVTDSRRVFKLSREAERIHFVMYQLTTWLVNTSKVLSN